MNKKRELIIEVHPNGKTFIEVDSLVRWFEELSDEGMKPLGEFAAKTLKSMIKHALSNPNKVMEVDEYYGRDQQTKH